MVATYTAQRESDDERAGIRAEGILDDSMLEFPRLGHDVRFILACVGGGAIRIGREVARQHLRYVETVAINCDPSVQDLEEFDRRVCIAPDSGDLADAGGSPAFGAQLARAAVPALERIFEGSTFVTVIGSLGGGAGTGTLPFVLDAAARSSQVLSVFVVKPFQCEGERRAVADRALARLHFIESYVEKQERGAAKLQVLDNEALLARGASMPFRRVNVHWGEVIANHIEGAFIAPAEAVLETHRMSVLNEPSSPAPMPLNATPTVSPSEPISPSPLAPHMAWTGVELGGPADVELTFEVDGAPRGPPFP